MRNIKQKNPTYKDVTCCKDWLLFSNFKRWMEQQDWEGKELDKGIIVYGNKMYSPETCAFVSRTTNSFVLENGTARGKCPLGVYWDKEKSFIYKRELSLRMLKLWIYYSSTNKL